MESITTNSQANSGAKPRTIAERLSKAARAKFIGRQAEISILLNAINAEELPFVVAFLHGPGGIGKSWLLRSILDKVGAKARTVSLDCREIEPTPDGFISFLNKLLGAAVSASDLNSIISSLTTLDKRAIICLDTYETFGLMDTWLRQDFIPELPDNIFIIIAGREAPNPAWFTTPGWQDLFREIELHGFSDEDADAMLGTRGLTTSQIRKVKNFAKGYPLALELAAAASRAQPDLEIKRGPPPKVLEQLTQVFLKGLPTDITEAVQASSCVRRVTEPLLKALLERSDIDDLFKDIQSLPFIDATADGFIFQDVVRDSISADLSLRCPERYQTYRKRAYAYFTSASHRAAANTLWQYTADLLYMIENPVARSAFFPEGGSDLRVEPASARDAGFIREITKAWEPPEISRFIEAWWHIHPEIFHIVKTPDDVSQAYYIIFEPGDVDRELLKSDPFTSAWLKHLEADPVEKDERVLFFPRWLDRSSGENPSPAVSACFLDIKRIYMEMRPSLRRIYCLVKDLSIFEPILFPLGFTAIESADVSIGGISYQTVMNDFGPSSIDGWLAKIAGQELVFDLRASYGRKLVTVLFTDIVDSTAKAVALGDTKWQQLLEKHHLLVREELATLKGREIDTAGDGFFAIFNKPANAIKCATAVRASVAKLGIDIRAGLHLGECEISDDGVRGITVHIGARVASKARSGEIFVSSTLKDAIAGSDFRFENRGLHKLKGIPGDWSLFAIKM